MFIIDKFKARTKDLCGQYGISQKHLCDQIGKQKTYLNDVWRGRCTPTDEDLQTISGILHTTPAYLKGETDDPKLPGEPETWTVPSWVGEIKKDPRKEGIMQRIAGMKVEDLLKLEKIMDMILGEK